MPTRAQLSRVVATSDAGAATHHPMLQEVLGVAAAATGAASIRLVETGDGEDPTSGAPLGVDGLALVVSGARPRELGLLDRVAALVRQAWVWSQVAGGSAPGSAAGRLRRASFRGWVGDKMRAALERNGSLSLLLVDLEPDALTRLYGPEDLEDAVPALYHAVEHAVRGVDSVNRCDDATIAIALPRCSRANAAKVAARIAQGLGASRRERRVPADASIRIRTYSHPGELLAFATEVQDADLQRGDEGARMQAWAAFLAGALEASALTLRAEPDGSLQVVSALGAPLPDQVPAGVETALREGRPQVVKEAGRSELVLPLTDGKHPVGALLFDSATASFGDAEVELGRHAAEHLGRLLARMAPSERGLEARPLPPRDRRYRFHYDDIIGDSPAMREVYDVLERVIDTDYPVIIQGESGTGKELIARAIHFNGSRRDKPLIAENCAALNDNLLEAELFGYEKGSFTGAETSRKGLFELADGGTLFLDEVADMKPGMQKDLLRILQEGMVRPVGGKSFRRVDVRIICASNNDLAHLVETGQFRSDLYYRLNVWNLRLPALRERIDDLPALIDHFLAKIAKQTGTPVKRLGRGVREALLQYDWPGNVRELKNEIARMVAMSSGDELSIRDFSKRPSGETARAAGGGLGPDVSAAAADDEVATLADLEKRHILRVLRYTNGNRARAAELLGINKATIYRKLKGYGLEA